MSRQLNLRLKRESSRQLLFRFGAPVQDVIAARIDHNGVTEVYRLGDRFVVEVAGCIKTTFPNEVLAMEHFRKGDEL